MIVWVQLPALKIHFYHKEVLTSLGNLIGRTIKLDYHTLNQQRAKFARLAVEVDLSKHLVPRIWLDDAWQKVKYENLPVVCFSCGKIGHTEEECPGKRPALPPPGYTNPNPATPVEGTTGNPEEPNPGFGPWLLVTRRSRRNQREGDRKGRMGEEADATAIGNQANSGKLLGNGRGSSPIRERETQFFSTQIQRSASQEKKAISGKKKGEEGNKGKAKAHLEGSSAGKGILGSGPTRPHTQAVGPKASRNSEKPSTSNPQPDAQADLLSEFSGPTAAASHVGPVSKPTTLPPPPATQTVIGPNGTKMQIVELRPSSDTTQSSPPAIARTKKNKNKKTAPLRSPSKLISAKALQVWTPKKDRKSKLKTRMASLTLQEIDAWTKVAQQSTESRGAVGEAICQEGAGSDAAMAAVATQLDD
ncbi:unnamed protein product [Linum tenue]|uniref:CCHC-type domain-containing protein n=1 Tax=Linum tenue TaxID=586396 RepID=A0AAV0PUA2_9ROSI|nr:unnamed protein product [Linum tenue]